MGCPRLNPGVGNGLDHLPEGLCLGKGVLGLGEGRVEMGMADVLVFATPIYYYEMCGQMKTLLDRMNPLYESDYAFREVYMIATAADGGDATFEKAYNGLQGWVDCFPKAKLCGLVAGEEIGDPKDAVNHPDVMEKAYELGKAL